MQISPENLSVIPFKFSSNTSWTLIILSISLKISLAIILGMPSFLHILCNSFDHSFLNFPDSSFENLEGIFNKKNIKLTQKKKSKKFPTNCWKIPNGIFDGIVIEVTEENFKALPKDFLNESPRKILVQLSKKFLQEFTNKFLKKPLK